MKYESKVLRTLSEADLTGIRMPAFVIYRYPTDFPEHYVVRVWSFDAPEPTPLPYVVLSSSLAESRRQILRAAGARGLIPLPRSAMDDDKIVESWV